VVSSRYGRLLAELAKVSKTPVAIHVYSFDESVEAIAREVGASFKKISSFEELYTLEELGRCDVGLVALDEDSETLTAAKVLKSIGVPVVIPVLNVSLNRDVAAAFGLKHAVAIDQYVAGNVLQLVLLDTWIYVNAVDYLGLGIALYRVWKRGLLGIRVKDLEHALEGKPVKLLVIDRHGRVITDQEHVVEQGDVIVVVGRFVELVNYTGLIDKLFTRYEQIYAQALTGALPTTTRVGG